MKQFNVLWSGREFYSLENCVISIRDGAIDTRSTIVGSYEGELYAVTYFLTTNARGETNSLRIDIQHNNQLIRHNLFVDVEGWNLDGHYIPEFKDCLDVDIPLTPFTNTLPINRLSLKTGESAEIRVIYCDLLSNSIHPVRQRYTRISETSYHYENVPNDFEATIIVDENGIVVDYPQLFERTAILRSNYGSAS